ncbi:hypothetical protein PENSPDRAFT_679927 [Peniophora sp. CONT]|nr:hypothetical protein PENSPDRAFT_679927 [Peniophora sp. CONT]
MATVAVASSSRLPLDASFNMHAPPPATAPCGEYALAQLYGDQVCLVQLNAPLSAAHALAVVDATIYRHEFINIFRHSHAVALHPSEMRVLELLGPASVARDEASGQVFLARDVISRLSALNDPRRRMSHGHSHSYSSSRGQLARDAYPRGLGARA